MEILKNKEKCIHSIDDDFFLNATKKVFHLLPKD